jgi:hypothetical protein
LALARSFVPAYFHLTLEDAKWFLKNLAMSGIPGTSTSFFTCKVRTRQSIEYFPKPAYGHAAFDTERKGRQTSETVGQAIRRWLEHTVRSTQVKMVEHAREDGGSVMQRIADGDCSKNLQYLHH